MGRKDLNADAELLRYLCTLWYTEVKASLGLLQGVQMGNFEKAGFAHPASIPVMASAY